MQRTLVTALVAALALGVAGAAQGERTKRGNVLVHFDGGITPHALPRTLAPASVWISSTIESTEGNPIPPQLQRIAIAINRAGKTFDRGLPACRVEDIQPATMKNARRICGDAIIGSGRVALQLVLEKDSPAPFSGRLLVFHARPRNGHKRIVAQIYGLSPPSAFVLVFKVRKQDNTFGTVIETTLPKSALRWAYITHFEMTLKRTFEYRGEQHSYINAACAAPEGFPGVVFPFARANFTFGDGREVKSTLVRECSVAT